MNVLCADCGGIVGQDTGPRDGWQMEDGRTVCQECCVAYLRQLAGVAAEIVAAAPGQMIGEQNE